MLVELSRGEVVESVHQVSAVVAGSDGPSLVWGDARSPVIARSALKFIQALPLLRSGAADRFGVSDDELVLACSSHSGEPEHVGAIQAWLNRIGLDEAALECGPDRPIGGQALIDHHRRCQEPAQVLNCCSGKHTGFLTVARHLGVDHAGYIEPDHPVQRLVTEAVEQLTGYPVADQQPGRDGCGIPTHGIPLAALAGGMSTLTNPAALDPRTRSAAARLIEAAPGREFWISGTGRHEMMLGRDAT
ncbi:MAG: asparaginase, partial [Acidimicrobiales bacterium]